MWRIEINLNIDACPHVKNLWFLLTFPIYYSFSAGKEIAIYTNISGSYVVTQGVTDPLMANVSTCVNKMIMLVCVGWVGILRSQADNSKKLNKTMHLVT